jgi:hypothetical protein
MFMRRGRAKKKLPCGSFFMKINFGAADQIRTDDLLHGKQTLYQLSYNRIERELDNNWPEKLCQSQLMSFLELFAL